MGSALTDIIKLTKGTINFVVRLCSSTWNNLDLTGRNLMNFDLTID
jgi:muramidase (phage lysozyme)